LRYCNFQNVEDGKQGWSTIHCSPLPTVKCKGYISPWEPMGSNMSRDSMGTLLPTQATDMN
jgi:hypothetical protein